MSKATKILLADDDRDDREIFSDTLASVDANVVYEGVEDGGEAIEALSDDANRPNIIFLDINMPVMNGWDVLRKLKGDSTYDDIPVIIYSTSSGEKEKRTAFDLGALCFVTKPDSVKLIKAMLEIVISKVKSNDVSPQLCREIQRLLRQA
ncbi:response regulator [Parachryseolinea silvisoli]|uniref:response regulator n=1 Tax=Parachryseolinea silvisoli TaxID=2873601 RepID=UPI0022658D8E|nr:response regulator [Parachryseolinea silvisoli]MCD9014145.1 response regulator [Parachryseolinea silvisoli]